VAATKSSFRLVDGRPPDPRNLVAALSLTPSDAPCWVAIREGHMIACGPTLEAVTEAVKQQVAGNSDDVLFTHVPKLET